MRSATGGIRLTASVKITNTLDDGAVAETTVGGQIINDSLDDGVESGEINRAWQKKAITITAGNFKSFNLRSMDGEDIGAGVGRDALGLPLAIEEVVFLSIRHVRGDGVLEINSTVPPAAAIAWLPKDVAADAVGGGMREGGLRGWYDPSADGLDLDVNSSVVRLDAVGGDVEAEIFVMGRHDDDDSSSSSLSSSSQSTSSWSSTSNV